MQVYRRGVGVKEMKVFEDTQNIYFSFESRISFKK